MRRSVEGVQRRRRRRRTKSQSENGHYTPSSKEERPSQSSKLASNIVADGRLQDLGQNFGQQDYSGAGACSPSGSDVQRTRLQHPRQLLSSTGMIDCCDATNQPAALVSINQEKAFDCVFWLLLNGGLQRFNFVYL